MSASALDLDAITYGCTDGIAVITINRPQKANSLRISDYYLLADRVREAIADEAARAIVLTAAGDKYFTVGDDFSDYGSEETKRFTELSILGRRTTEFPVVQAGKLLWNAPKPVIAAINGSTMLPELLWWCDFRIMAEHATIVERNVRVGVAPGCGGTQLTTRLFGRAVALRLAMLGEPLTAAEAYRLGVVNEVVPTGRALDAALDWGRRMLAAPATALAMAKLSVNAAQEMSLDQGLQMEAMSSYLSELTGDVFKVAESFMKDKGASDGG